MNEAPLAGIRVLDLTQFLSGPYCTQILADMGAEVIKVEAPDGDLARHIPPHFVNRDSVYFLSINRLKKSVAIDLKTKAGQALLQRLAARCDVVVENFRPGVLDKLGLNRDALRAERPELVWCSISGFGQTGPYRDKPAYDMIVQALSGGMSLTGEPGRVAVRAGVPIGDICAGIYAATGIVAALFRRERTQRGDAVDIAMLDCQAAMLSYQGAYFLHSGEVPGRQGSAHDSIPTYRTFMARDGREVVITANTDRMWQGLCRVIDRTELIDDPRFLSNRERLANRTALWAIIEPAFLEDDARSWVDKLEAEGIPVGLVNTLDGVMADPQLQHRGMIAELVSDEGHSIKVMGNPLHFAEAARVEDRYPPTLGGDTRAVIEDLLGMSRTEIEALFDSRVIVAPTADLVTS